MQPQEKSSVSETNQDKSSSANLKLRTFVSLVSCSLCILSAFVPVLVITTPNGDKINASISTLGPLATTLFVATALLTAFATLHRRFAFLWLTGAALLIVGGICSYFSTSQSFIEGLRSDCKYSPGHAGTVLLTGGLLMLAAAFSKIWTTTRQN